MKIVNLIALSLIAMPFSISAQLEKTDKALEPQEKRMKMHHKGQRGKKAEHMLKRIDTNSDGKIDLNEYLSNAEQRFQAMDQNSDGFVMPEEMRAHGKEMRVKHRKAMKAAKKAYRDSKDASEALDASPSPE